MRNVFLHIYKTTFSRTHFRLTYDQKLILIDFQRITMRVDYLKVSTTFRFHILPLLKITLIRCRPNVRHVALATRMYVGYVSTFIGIYGGIVSYLDNL
jgi:hypothetical protein